MSRNKKISIILVIVISVILIVAMANRKSPEEVLINKGLNILYTVSEYDEIEEIYNELSNIEQSDFFEVMDFGFREICTDECYKSIFANRLYTMYREAPFKNKFTVSVEDIVLEKRPSSSDDQIFNYKYKVKLKLNYFDQGEYKEVVEQGFIGTTKINNEWKISGIRPFRPNKVFFED